ncbi:hypothetical protein [Echinicola vietnamensis]|uniref:Uncharacterized protein n=1 Tax=Echinicola vietnamensis (strain DSM 17526 / LMG 23754 / KMM 6221) TaxID=926556 RepID=L0FUS3_ECHVK|nr:hypothetical protein [Echinicola vietnamensis]AGA77644.1 hypothetical protein Echvi_1375 [Echinicola vietnamensis DSM 17526]
MKTVKFSFMALALVLGFALVSFAKEGNGKTEAKSSDKNEAVTATQWAVTGETTDGGVEYYTVQTPSGSESCPGGPDACLISSETPPDMQSRIPKNQATVDDFRNGYN